MASESSPPPPPGGGAKYAILGVVLLALAGGAYCLTNSGTPPETATSSDAPDAYVVPPSTAMQDEILEIPEEVPDAWSEVPDAGRRPAGPRGPVMGSWDCSGEIDRAALQSVITEHRPQIQACYERRLKQQALLQGNMQLQLRIAQSGSVDAVQVGGTLRDREVFSCVRNVASRMQFARVSGGNCAVVSVPFSFTPQQ
ncbi:MAG: AgmX/PglI C-terminal domain-containing protein [Deltaproteobacteria bacterium]|nr:AgmX/PglI C-terminal domain-containing protein [Deltaproteobacteria bacterium]